MSDPRRYLLALLLVAVPLQGQATGEVARLRQRLAAQQAHRERLAARVALRDSNALAAQHLVVLGAPPLQVAVPPWAEQIATPIVEARLASWRARYGSAFARFSAETVVVAFPSDTNDWSRAHLDDARARFGDLIASRMDRALAAQVFRSLDPEMLRWIGPVPAIGAFAAGRRRAVLGMITDTAGVGARCLEGVDRACRELLEREWKQEGWVARGNFLAFALEAGGPEALGRLMDRRMGTPPEHLARTAGRPLDQLATDWGIALRRPAEPGSTGNAMMVALVLALVWTLGFATLFLGRLTWHHV